MSLLRRRRVTLWLVEATRAGRGELELRSLLEVETVNWVGGVDVVEC